MDADAQQQIEWTWVYGEADDHTQLHHLASGSWQEEPFGPGTTSCGTTGTWSVPGMFSRMSVDRCGACCDALGWPHGVGSPKNDDRLRPLAHARLGRTLHEGAGL